MPIQSANPPDIITIDQFKGLNQQSSRSTIDDQELWWNENLYAVAPGQLRSCWGPSAPIYTAPAGVSIVRTFFGYYGYPTTIFTEPPPGRMGWMFLSDGTVDEVDLDTQAVVHLGQIWQPKPPYYFADAVVWRPKFFGNVAGQSGGVLFGSPQGMYAWDGITMYAPGQPAPDWLTSANEQPTVSTVMPTGLPGIIAMAVYQGRAWVMGESVISFSAVANGADFSVAGGGGSFGYSGDVLTTTYRDMRASAGYLYVFGDSSTDLISNVITFGDGSTTPFTTQFNYQNLDPMVGHGFPRKVGHDGRYSLMATGARPYPSTGQTVNSGQGVWLMRGGDAESIGQKVTNIWMTLDSSQYYPTFATVTMFGRRIVLLNGLFVDPWGVKRNLILGYDGIAWTVFSQGNLTNIGYVEQDSICDAYGTDGTHLFHLFNNPDNTLVKKLSTKAVKGKGPLAHLSINNWKRMFVELHDKTSLIYSAHTGFGVALTGTVTTSGGGVPNGVQDVAFQLAPGTLDGIEAQPLSGQGIMAAIDMQSLSPDFVIERIHLSAEARTLFGA
jgi:hypothetical protein